MKKLGFKSIFFVILQLCLLVARLTLYLFSADGDDTSLLVSFHVLRLITVAFSCYCLMWLGILQRIRTSFLKWLSPSYQEVDLKPEDEDDFMATYGTTTERTTEDLPEQRDPGSSSTAATEKIDAVPYEGDHRVIESTNETKNTEVDQHNEPKNEGSTYHLLKVPHVFQGRQTILNVALLMSFTFLYTCDQIAYVSFVLGPPTGDSSTTGVNWSYDSTSNSSSECDGSHHFDCNTCTAIPDWMQGMDIAATFLDIIAAFMHLLWLSRHTKGTLRGNERYSELFYVLVPCMTIFLEFLEFLLWHTLEYNQFQCYTTCYLASENTLNLLDYARPLIIATLMVRFDFLRQVVIQSFFSSHSSSELQRKRAIEIAEVITATVELHIKEKQAKFKMTSLIKKKPKTIEEKAEIAARRAEITAKRAEIAAKKAEIAAKKARTSKEKAATTEEQAATIEEQAATIEEQAVTIEEQAATIEEITAKDLLDDTFFEPFEPNSPADEYDEADLIRITNAVMLSVHDIHEHHGFDAKKFIEEAIKNAREKRAKLSVSQPVTHPSCVCCWSENGKVADETTSLIHPALIHSNNNQLLEHPRRVLGDSAASIFAVFVLSVGIPLSIVVLNHPGILPIPMQSILSVFGFIFLFLVLFMLIFAIRSFDPKDFLHRFHWVDWSLELFFHVTCATINTAYVSVLIHNPHDCLIDTTPEKINNILNVIVIWLLVVLMALSYDKTIKLQSKRARRLARWFHPIIVVYLIICVFSDISFEHLVLDVLPGPHSADSTLGTKFVIAALPLALDLELNLIFFFLQSPTDVYRYDGVQGF